MLRAARAAADRQMSALLIDEIDTLVGDSLLSVLQQLHAGYPGRSAREHDGLESVVDEGVKQTARYMDGSASEEDHLVVIDRRQNRSWEEKVFHLRPGGGEMPVDV